MTAPAFGQVKPELQRGAGGRPLILSPDGSGALIEYDRASSYGKVLDDGFGLTYWAKCMVLLGASKSPSIIKAARPLTYDADKKNLHTLAEQAMNLAGAGDKRDEGSALHSYTELIDKGLPLPDGLEPELVADLDAYRRVTAGLVHTAVERFVVIDELRVAGSLDRAVLIPSAAPWPEWLWGRECIADLKTGNAEAAIAGIAVQLALYSRGQGYDIATGARTPQTVDQHVGLVIHLPLGTGKAQVLAVNLDVGWEGALAAQTAHAFNAKAKLACKRCVAGYFKNGNPCFSCKGVARVPVGVQVLAA